MKNVFPEGMRVIKPGGHYTLVGLVHPNSQLDVTAEQIIRKCLTFRGMMVYCTDSKVFSDIVNKLSLALSMHPTYLCCCCYKISCKLCS